MSFWKEYLSIIQESYPDIYYNDCAIGDTADRVDGNNATKFNKTHLSQSLPLDNNKYGDHPELTSSHPAQNSSFSKPQVYEKSVKKQMPEGDPKITSILMDSKIKVRHGRRTVTPSGSDNVRSKADHYDDSQGSNDHRPPSCSDQKSSPTLCDSQGTYDCLNLPPNRLSDHSHAGEFQPITNRSVSAANLSRHTEESHVYDYLPGRYSMDRVHRDVCQQNLQSHRGLSSMSPARRWSESCDKRSSTPHSHHHNITDMPTQSSSRQLVFKSALITNRTEPLQSSLSGSSFRSSQPVTADMIGSISRSSQPVNTYSKKGDATKLQDLEDNIITLKRVLSERDQETNLLRKENQDLHATNCQLKTQLEDYQKDSRKSPIATSDSDETKEKETQPAAILNSDVTPETKSEYERQIKQLMNERENLETEMWTLRQKLGVRADDTLGERADDTLGERADDTLEGDSAVLDNYKPDNPYALQRKIDDLESQIQDLQEANETSVSNNAKYEWEIHKLLQENGKLKEELSSGKKDLEAENQTLREEVDRLKSVQDGGIMNGGNLDEFGLQREVLALRQDLHLLRDKNHQLNEDNIKLIEHLQDLRRREKEQMMPAPVAQHIPRGILDKNGSRNEEIQLSDYEYRGFSPIHNPADEDKHSVQSSLSGKYSSGNLRPGSRQTDPVYRQFSDALHRGHNSHQISLHDGEIHADRKQHQPRSILRKKEPLISYDYRDDFSKHPPADRYLERSSLSDFGKTPKHSSLAGSNSSLESILDELEQSFGVSVGRSSENRRNQTRSAGAMDLRHRSSRSVSPTSMGSTGFRSISPKPVPTQHNRGLFGMETPRNENFSTLGKHPFAPRNPADIHIHDVVKFARQGGRICKGLVKFVGHLPGRNDTYIGVELDKDDGKHDGTFEGIRYFKCKPNKGVFIAFSKVVMAWGV